MDNNKKEITRKIIRDGPMPILPGTSWLDISYMFTNLVKRIILVAKSVTLIGDDWQIRIFFVTTKNQYYLRNRAFTGEHLNRFINRNGYNLFVLIQLDEI